MSKNTIAICIGLFVVTSSCQKNTQTNLPTKFIIVEGYPNPGDSTSLKVSKILLYDSNDSVQQTIDTLHVKLMHGHSVYTLTPKGNGEYTLQNNAFMINDGDSVFITFT